MDILPPTHPFNPISAQAPENLAALRRLEEAYLASGDPYRGSGFNGSPDRWRQEREPILNAIPASGDFLDIGCANGLLLESLIKWGAERGGRSGPNGATGANGAGITLTPYGVDVGPRLIADARERLPAFADNLFIGDVWQGGRGEGWHPPRRFDYVYSVCDIVPQDRLGEYVSLLMTRMVLPGGRLILGSYATREGPAADLPALLRAENFGVAGSTAVGRPARSCFVWIDACEPT